jgi:DNA-binding NarL/FixJ family response regulator
LPIHVLLADDDLSVLEAVRALLEAEGDFQVVGCATNGSDAVLLAGQLRVDLAILDFSMPGIDGAETARRIAAISSATRILMVSGHAVPAHAASAMQAGAHGYLLKESVGKELLAAVRAVVAGRRYLSESLKKL